MAIPTPTPSREGKEQESGKENGRRGEGNGMADGRHRPCQISSGLVDCVNL